MTHSSETLKRDLPLATSVFPRWFQFRLPRWLLRTTGVGPNLNPPFTHPKSGDGSGTAVCSAVPAASLEGLCSPTGVCNEEILEQVLKLVLNTKLYKMLFSSSCCNSAMAFKYAKVKCCCGTALRILQTDAI